MSAAQWTADKLKDPSTAKDMAEKISGRILNMNESDYTAIITAKTDKNKQETRDSIIKKTLDKIML